jgi:hypothetical protein
MTRKEILEKILEMHKMKMEYLLNCYKNQEIDIETLDVLVSMITNDLVQHVTDLARASDDEQNRK